MENHLGSESSKALRNVRIECVEGTDNIFMVSNKEHGLLKADLLSGKIIGLVLAKIQNEEGVIMNVVPVPDGGYIKELVVVVTRHSSSSA